MAIRWRHLVILIRMYKNFASRGGHLFLPPPPKYLEDISAWLLENFDEKIKVGPNFLLLK